MINFEYEDSQGWKSHLILSKMLREEIIYFKCMKVENVSTSLKYNCHYVVFAIYWFNSESYAPIYRIWMNEWMNEWDRKKD
jgi:hypothetical protein